MPRLTETIHTSQLATVKEKLCSTCRKAMAIEWKGESGKPETVTHFCITRECPQYRAPQIVQMTTIPISNEEYSNDDCTDLGASPRS